MRDSVSQAIDDKVEESRGRNASILDSRISEPEKRLVRHLDQMGTVPLNQPWVEVNDIDASVTPVVAK